MMGKIGMLLQVFYLLRSKLFWILVILCIFLYFGYKKYGDEIIEKNPKLKEIKNDIESVNEKAKGTKEIIDSVKKTKS